MWDAIPAFPLPKQWHSHCTMPSPTPAALNHITRARQIWCQALLLPDVPEPPKLYEAVVAFSFHSFLGVEAPKCPSESPLDYGAWTNPLIHKLLTWRPAKLQDSPKTRLQEMMRIGILLYLCPVWRFFGVSPVDGTTFVSKLRDLLTTGNVGQLGLDKFWMFHLWVLYVGGVEAQCSCNGSWYYEQIFRIMRKNSLLSWHEGLDIIKNVLWFSCLFEGRDGVLRAEVDKLLEV
jgi:hypothetical protein